MTIEQLYHKVSEARLGSGVVIDLAARDEAGWSLLHIAALKGDQKNAEWLVAQGADVDSRTSLDFTPSDIAIQSLEFDLAEYFHSAAEHHKT